MALIINAFYGSVKQLEEMNDVDLQVDLHPFNFTQKGECPAWLRDSVGPLIENGTTVPAGRATKPRHVDGESISRGINYYAAIKQLEMLRTLAASLECTIEARISRCGKIGRFALRFLVGLEGVKVNFVDFPADWTESLKTLKPFRHTTVNMRSQDREHVPASRIVSFGDDDEPAKDVCTSEGREYLGEGEGEPVVEEEVVKPAPKKRATRTKKVVEEEPTEVEVEEVTTELEPVVEEEVAKPAPKKRATRTKKVVEEEPTELEPVAEEEAAKPAPKKRATKKSATLASDDKLSELGTKFATTSRK